MDTKCKPHFSMRLLLGITLVSIVLLSNIGYSIEKNVKDKVDWYQWRGPNRDGISTENDILKHWPKEGPNILWRISVGDGYSGISTSNGKLFTMWDEGESQFLFCLNANSGKELWRYKVGKNFKNGWGDGPRSTPLVDKDVVYSISTEGLLHAVNITTGKVLWTRDLDSEYGSQIPSYGYSSSPMIDGEVLFIQVGGKKDYAFVALNKNTGNLLWHSETDEQSYSSPIVVTMNNIRQIVCLSAKGLYSVSLNDGSLLWHYSWNARCPSTGIPVNSITPIFVAPDKIFISGGFGTIKGAAVVQVWKQQNQFVAKKFWNNENMNNLINTSVLVENHIYGFDDTVLKCVDALTGKEKWKARGFNRGSLIGVDRHLIVLGEKGDLALVEATPKEYKKVESAKIMDGKCWTSPSLSNGKLYLRNHEEMVCLDLRGNHPTGD